MNRWSVLFAFTSIGMLAVGLGRWGFLSRDDRELSFQDSPVRVMETPISGELINVSIVLKKAINDPIEVLGVVTACGCTEFSVDGVGALSDSSGFIMKESDVGCSVTIDTIHKSGKQRFGFQLRYRRPDSDDIATLNGGIEVTILRGIVADPARIEIESAEPGQPILVNIFDDTPGSLGVPLSHCEVSDQQILQASLRSSVAPNVQFPRGDGFVPRHQLRLDWLSAPEPNSRHWVNVVPAIPGAMTLQIPIVIAGRSPDTCIIEPQHLVVTKSENVAGTTRAVTLRSRDGWDLPPVAHFPKDLCRVTIVPGIESSERVAQVELFTGCQGNFEIEFDCSQGKRLQLPVTVVCLDE